MARAGLRAGHGCAASARWPSCGRGGWREEYYLKGACSGPSVRERARSPSVRWRQSLGNRGSLTLDGRSNSLSTANAEQLQGPACFVPASVLQAASSKEGYPSGKRSLCSSSRARSVPARVEVNRQNPPEMQKTWPIWKAAEPPSRLARAARFSQRQPGPARPPSRALRLPRARQQGLPTKHHQ